MVKINDRFEFRRSTYCWVLSEWRDGKNKKTGEPTRNVFDSYWDNLTSLCNAIIDRSCDAANETKTILDCITNARNDILSALGGADMENANLNDMG